MTRRTKALVLIAVVAVAGVVAAAVVQGPDAPTPSQDAGAQSQDTTQGESLDLREANVVNVTLEERESGEYDFAVTLFHDDDGEDGYADRWVVETLNGTELGTRELLHAHSTDPFTRSTTVAVPENVTLVVVRGHDQTHEYGGQAMVVDVRTGATQAVQQGAERREFADCEVSDAATTTTTGAATTATATTTGGAALVSCS